MTLTGIFTGGTGAVNQGVGAVTSGTAAAVSPAISTTYTLTVTNSLGTSVSAATRVVYGSLAVFAGKPSGIGNLNGSGTGARFFGPTSSAMDDAGNLYVADRYNNTIRMISSGGVVTTLAGTTDLTGSTDAPVPCSMGRPASRWTTIQPFRPTTTSTWPTPATTTSA